MFNAIFMKFSNKWPSANVLSKYMIVAGPHELFSWQKLNNNISMFNVWFIKMNVEKFPTAR